MLTLTRIASIGEALRDTIITHKANVALIEADRHRENGRWTYRELAREAERFAALLEGQGFEAGDRCAILMQNQSKWIFAGLGALWAGAVLVPLDYKLTAPEQMALIEHSKPAVLVTEYPTWQKLQREPRQGLERTLVFVTEAPEGAELGRARRFESAPRAAFELRGRTREDVACIVYSSGTSGTPKGCMLTHANYLEQAQVLGRLFPIGEDDRYLSVLPTNHAIDFMLGFIMPLLFGAAIVHQRSLRAQFIRMAMKEYGITHVGLVPSILKNLEKRLRERLEELPDWQRIAVDNLARLNDLLTAREPNHKLSRTLLQPLHAELGGKLRMIFAGGSFVDRELAEFFYKHGIPVVIGYGQTEACTVVSVNDLKPFRGNTVGKPVPGVDVEIRAPNGLHTGSPAEGDEGVGEVWVRGPTVMKGYLDAPELTAETIVGGWLRTGDLGTIDAAGHLELRGRVRNMIVTEGGKNIYPEDLERHFDDLPECAEACVFAANYIWRTSKMTGEQLVLVVRPDNEATTVGPAFVAELRRRNRELPDYKRLSGYIVRTRDFPATASLKVKRDRLADELRTLRREDAIVPLDDDA